MDDARLCLEVLLTASACGAPLANYVEAIAFENRAGELHSVRVLARWPEKKPTIRTRLVLNATGPWVDQVCRLAGASSRGHACSQPRAFTSCLRIRGCWRGSAVASGGWPVFFVLP